MGRLISDLDVCAFCYVVCSTIELFQWKMDKLLGKNYLWKLTHDETEHIMVVYLLRKSMVLSKRFSLSYMWRSPGKQTKGPQSLDRAMKRSQPCSDLGEQIARGASSRCAGSEARAPWRGRWGVQRPRRSGPIRTWRSVWFYPHETGNRGCQPEECYRLIWVHKPLSGCCVEGGR